MRRKLCLAVAAVSACGGCGGGDDGGAVDAARSPDAATASGVARLVHGAAPPATFAAIAPPPAPATDGRWYVTPDQVHLKLNRIRLDAATGGTGGDLTDCGVTFDKTLPSLSALLDCPFPVDAGTYVSMTVFVDGTAQVLVNDPVNGIFTDPGSGTGLSGTEPAGGATFVDYVRPLGESGVQVLFPEPLVVDEGGAVALTIVLDGIQTLPITVSGGGSSLQFGNLDYFPANVFPTLTAPGVARVYTSANTAESYNDDLVLANKLRVYGDADGQPIYAFTEQTATAINNCALPAPAYPSDPGGAPPVGGWLGRDGAGTTCWASSRDGWQTYDGYFTFSDVTTVGGSGLLSCQDTTNPTPPTSGSTYASGCPTITATATDSLMLVAD
jgi:hypothetical protein